MPPHKALKLLTDVRVSCDAICEVVGDRDPLDALAVRRDRASILYELMIVGEALNQAVKFDPGLEREVGQIPQIIGFRNRIVHGYDKVSLELVAKIIAMDLPILKQEVMKSLEKWGGDA